MELFAERAGLCVIDLQERLSAAMPEKILTANLRNCLSLVETARVLAKRGAYIVGAARTEQKAKDALASLGIPGTGVACELSEPASVRAAVEAVLL